MNRKDIHLLYQYNRWANARILDAATKIIEPFERPPQGRFAGNAGSIIMLFTIDAHAVRILFGTIATRRISFLFGRKTE